MFVIEYKADAKSMYSIYTTISPSSRMYTHVDTSLAGICIWCIRMIEIALAEVQTLF